MYQPKSPPPLAIFACKKGGGLNARQATSAKIRKKPAKNATFSRNLAKNGQKTSYKRGGTYRATGVLKKNRAKKGGGT